MKVWHLIAAGWRRKIRFRFFSSLDISQELIQQFRPLGKTCPLCAEPNRSGQVCGRCLNLPSPDYEHARVVYEYEGVLKQRILQFKYGSDLAMGRSLGLLMAQHFQQSGAEIQALIPIPLHKERLLERGFNQSLELANQVAKHLQCPVLADSLTRVKATDHQTGLSRKAREQNLQNAFQCRKPLPPSLSHVALIDDVFTTGATLKAASSTLKKHWPHVHIEVWCLARALEKDESSSLSSR